MNRRLSRKWQLIALSALIVPCAAFANPFVSLELIPDRTLPGVPVIFHVTIANPTSSAVTIRNGAMLEVVPAAGSSFIASDGGEALWESFDKKATDPNKLIIEAGQRLDFYQQDDGTMISREYWWDRRLTKPGTYQLRLKLIYPTTSLLEEPVAFFSNAVTLTVDVPQGDDALVWARMRQMSKSDGFSGPDWANHQFRLAQEIYSAFPRSNYVPHVASFAPGVTLDEKLRLVEHALTVARTGVVADRVKLIMAGVYWGLTDQARAVHNLQRALEESAKGRRILEGVKRDSSFSFIRAIAASKLANWPADQYLRERIEREEGYAADSPTPRVVPFVDCVSVKKDGRLTARFGYSNLKNQKALIEPGTPQNVLSPGASAKKHPSVFQPGEHHKVFKVSGSGPAIVWTLLGNKAVAYKESARCSSDDDDD